MAGVGEGERGDSVACDLRHRDGKLDRLGGAVEEHRRSHENRRARSVGRSCRRVRLGSSRGPSKRRWCPYRRGGTPQRRSPPVRPSRGKVVSGECTRGAIGRGSGRHPSGVGTVQPRARRVPRGRNVSRFVPCDGTGGLPGEIYWPLTPELLPSLNHFR